MTALLYQQYWDDQEYIDGLRSDIAEVIGDVLSGDTPREIADAIVAKLFTRVQLHDWCERPGCFGNYCTPTHYAYRIQTVARAFATPAEVESNAHE